MQRYQVHHRYRSTLDGQTFGPWEPPDTVELSDVDAEWVNRDSPGCLSVVGASTSPAVEAVELTVAVDGEAEAPKDRAHRGGRKRAG